MEGRRDGRKNRDILYIKMREREGRDRGQSEERVKGERGRVMGRYGEDRERERERGGVKEEEKERGRVE